MKQHYLVSYLEALGSILLAQLFKYRAVEGGLKGVTLLSTCPNICRLLASVGGHHSFSAAYFEMPWCMSPAGNQLLFCKKKQALHQASSYCSAADIGLSCTPMLECTHYSCLVYAV